MNSLLRVTQALSKRHLTSPNRALSTSYQCKENLRVVRLISPVYVLLFVTRLCQFAFRLYAYYFGTNLGAFLLRLFAHMYNLSLAVSVFVTPLLLIVMGPAFYSTASRTSVLIIELLRTAEQAVEQIKKLATRFVLTDRLFEALVQNGKVNPSLRRDWLRKKHKFDVEADKVLEFVVRKTSDFEKIVDELCKEKRKAERRLNDSDQERRPELQKKQLLQILREEMALEAQSTTEQIRSLKERVKSQEAEIARLKGIIQTKEQQETEKPGPSRVQVTVDASDGAKGGAALEQVPIEMETDEDYFEKMVQEVQEDEEMTDTEQEEEEREDSSGRIIQLCQQALELEQVLQTFPYRDFGDRKVSNTCTFCGAVDRHFSDSCPQVQDGHDRNTIVDRKKVCKCCFGNCPKDKCRFPPRDCYYCERIRGTIVEDLIPKKRHHRALCEVPDLKNEVRKRIKRLEEEIERLRSEERFKPGG
ncbi:hypothetical protein OSTOST_07573, partial [Ostertagia ostertagi]